MEFNSLGYVLFYALVFVLYFAPFMRKPGRQTLLVLVASYYFYASWDWRFLGLIVLTTISSYLTGIAIERWRKKIFLVGNIFLNIGILCIFKYLDFFGENITWFLRMSGWEVDWVFLNLLLPVGISFYTFQAIGYTVDVWRKEVVPVRNPLLFATFIAYFPQLVAGPIEKASRLLPQLSDVHGWSYPRAVMGLRQILWGMFKKVAVADPCGTLVTGYYNAGDDIGGLKIYLAAVMFAVQIYCDFSGYCDIAQGSARILGVELMDNFKRPFFSRSFIELWHRWHISLMQWFTSYVYIPLGGSRKGSARKYLNIMLVFLLSGLWHGAAWGFVMWGVYCGAVYVAEAIMKVPGYKSSGAPQLNDIPELFLTFSLFVIGFVFFRVNDVWTAFMWNVKYVIPISIALYLIVRLTCMAINGMPSAYMASMGRLFTFQNGMYAVSLVSVVAAIALGGRFWFHLYWLLAAVVLACEWHTRRLPVTIAPFPGNRAARFGIYFLFYILIVAYGLFRLPPLYDDTQFIYFQF